MTEITKCPICQSNARRFFIDASKDKFNCDRCGQFLITGSASASWPSRHPNPKQIANACGWIREHQGTTISSDTLQTLLSISTPSVAERAKKILIAIEKSSLDLSDSFTLDTSNGDNKYWLGISYSDNAHELLYLFSTYLVDETAYLSCTNRIPLTLNNIQITPKGYAFLDSLKHTNTLSQIGFCAMWFDTNVTPVWTDAISLAIRDAGYDPKRIDTHQHNNRIDDEIIAMIRRSKFVVADFTGQRGGVYFEAGFALGLGLTVIWTCEKSDLEKVHFDNRQYNFLLWEKDKLAEFKEALQNRIEATLGHGTFNQ